ncbi:MAG: preprotein translocase subunit SecG [Spirochaetes bacterium]|nr:MAG: preprotein translocase subunit SecG [Spirochaetota bacterium]
MGIIGILLLILFLIASLLLITVVLIQDEQGEGLGGLFGGGGSATLGPRSGNILTRITAILGTIFFFCAFGLAWLNKTPEAGNVIKAARQESTQEGRVIEWWKTEEAEEENIQK